MTNEEFKKCMEESIQRSKDVLGAKAVEYAGDMDRLENFKAAAAVQGITPVRALVGMMTKHYVSITKMARSSHPYNPKVWDEKLVDLRNYTILLDALLRDEEPV